MSYPKLNGVVQSAPNKSLGFDVDSRISYSDAKKFVNHGYKFCLRYISLGSSEDQGDLNHEEASDILEAGLALMPVQHVRGDGWHPNTKLGKEYGENAARHAEQIGFPTEVNLWCDLEGILKKNKNGQLIATSKDVIEYCNAWYYSVCYRGYIPGLYVGANTLLNQSELYHELAFQHYWKSASKVAHPYPRNYQMIQFEIDKPLHDIDIKIDNNKTYIDNYGGRPQWLINPRKVRGL
ncbi:MAG: DUF1906 domain-containing protein [Symploca sp. SIO2E9]|nr:DUF1906 domain-containing protein [Symploca sp. SIO2E9]